MSRASARPVELCLLERRMKLIAWQVIGIVTAPLWALIEFGFYLHERWQWWRYNRSR